jgi:LPS sulfotransferase NodH
VVFAGARPNSRAVGFKVFGEHVRCAGTERLFTRLKTELPELRFVHITRPNYLDALISRVMAETTRNWVRPVGGDEPQALPRIHIDPERSLRFFAAMHETDRFFERFFAGPSYLKVKYENLAQNFSAQMNQVYEFLSVPKYAVEPVIQKQITQSRAQVVENLEELRAAAKGTPYVHLYDLA